MSKKIKKNIAVENRKAKYNYIIEEVYEVGLVLLGQEIQSIRKGKVSIDHSYASEKDGAIWVNNLHIDINKLDSKKENNNAIRPKKLLLKKKEIEKIKTKITNQGYTLVPLNIHYNSKGFAKLDLGLSKGRRKEDKREYKKEQDWKREKDRLVSKGFK